MQRIRIILAIVLALLEPGLLPARAGAQRTDPVPYKLEAGSAFERGCFGPCECAVLDLPMGGDFALTRVSQTTLFTTYAVTGVDWKVASGSQILRLTGSGTYRVGGEVAVQQQLVLDLSLDGRPAERFDSGLVPGGGAFPRIDIQVAAHGFACYDTVLAVRAAPTPTDAGPENAAGTLAGIGPNPFRQAAEVHCVLPVPGRVDLTVFDVRGRTVRSLARDLALGAGRHTFLWNGDRDDGSRAPSGTYLMRLAVNGRVSLRRVVKVQ